ncbi:transposable element Tcb2 transposase [Trichonephila clavipes]|nr:transposable element Tcb2 transposase [Trichonephila clavipes]
MDDNARSHRTLAVEELWESEDISRMDWSEYSPDLNPIEHVWDALGRRIAARLHHPENTQQLKQMLIEEWALLPQEMLQQLVLSMQRRCEATIASKSSQTNKIHPFLTVEELSYSPLIPPRSGHTFPSPKTKNTSQSPLSSRYGAEESDQTPVPKDFELSNRDSADPSLFHALTEIRLRYKCTLYR